MVKHQLGELDLKDFLQIVRPKFGWRRRLGALLAGVACILCFCAGRFGPWSGKGAANLTLAEALQILDQAPQEDWEHKLGVHAAHVHASRALDALATVSRDPSPAGGDASRSLRHLTRRGIKHVQDLAPSSAHSEIHHATLQFLRNDLSQ